MAELARLLKALGDTRSVLSGGRDKPKAAPLPPASWTLREPPDVTGGLSQFDDHPSRKHDSPAKRTRVVTPPDKVEWPPAGAPRRRDRRAAARAKD